jgi:signal transduction histidine kinase
VNGVLVLCDDGEHALRPGVQESIMLLANYAGAALRNASLYSQIDVAYQRLQELDRLKSEFIAIASHELRTPLSIVLGYSMMVHDQTQGDKHEYMHRVMESAQRIKEVVDDMVSLRHLETGEAPPTLEAIIVQDLVRQVFESMQPLAVNNHHTLVARLPDEPLVVQSDREKLLLIFNHLLSNAIKFTPPDGQIVVAAAIQSGAAIVTAHEYLIPQVPEPQTQWVVLTFQDNGIGIPERDQRRIFDRFYQVADSLRRDRGGIGLGLALVRELVVALGGLVWVYSREGEGSVFAVALPYVPA